MVKRRPALAEHSSVSFVISSTSSPFFIPEEALTLLRHLNFPICMGTCPRSLALRRCPFRPSMNRDLHPRPPKSPETLTS